MKETSVPDWILQGVACALRLASNRLESHKRETALDRQVVNAHDLLLWVLRGKEGNPPRYI